MDHPEVACIMLANSNLDAAKLNRCLQVTQRAASEADLLALARGCLCRIPAAPDADLLDLPPQPLSREETVGALATHAAVTVMERELLLSRLCRAFKLVQSDPQCWLPHAPRLTGVAGAGEEAEVCGIFHQRDFVYLLRYMKRYRDREAAATGRTLAEVDIWAAPFSLESLLAGLRRNFGGVTEAAFTRIAGIFLRECGFDRAGAAAAATLGTVSTLRESLGDTLGPADDPNVSAFRHVLLLDPTDVDVAKDLLFELGLLDRKCTVSLLLSEFSDDAALLRRSEAVASIKEAAEKGHTVLLSNAGPIASSVFDLLNRHFTVVATRGRDGAVVKTHYAQVAVGSFSRPVAVHPSFRIIVHVSAAADAASAKPGCNHSLPSFPTQMPLSAVGRAPLPFLNRFEKYTLSLSAALDERLASLDIAAAAQLRRAQAASDLSVALPPPCDDPVMWRAILCGVSDFATAMGGDVSMPGFVPGETAAALVLRALQDSAATPGRVVVVRPAISTAEPWCDAGFEGAGAAASTEFAAPSAVVRAVSSDAPLPRRSFPEEGTSRPRERLREIIRRLNFQLLQLLRPESLLLLSGLRLLPAYREEYVLRQEHFSAASLFRSVLASRWVFEASPRLHAEPASVEPATSAHGAIAVSLEGSEALAVPVPLAAPAPSPHCAAAFSPPSKLMVFTRSDAEVAFIGMTATPVLRIMQAAAADAAARLRAAGATPIDSEVTAGDLFVLQLKAFSSSAAVTDAVAAFVDGDDKGSRERPRRVLFVLADMAAVTAGQLNHARHVIDARLGALPSATPRPSVLFLLHCPPEQLQVGFPYHAIPTGGWDFVFADSLCLGAATAAAASPGSAGAGGARLAPTDPRSWVAIMYGLAELPTPEAARAEFGGVFIESLRRAVASFKVNGVSAATLASRGVVASAPLYVEKPRGRPKAVVEAAEAARVALVVRVFERCPPLRDALLDSWLRVLHVRFSRRAAASLSGALRKCPPPLTAAGRPPADGARLCRRAAGRLRDQGRPHGDSARDAALGARGPPARHVPRGVAGASALLESRGAARVPAQAMPSCRTSASSPWRGCCQHRCPTKRPLRLRSSSSLWPLSRLCLK